MQTRDELTQRFARRRRAVRRLVLARRRSLAAILAAGAVLTGVHELRPPRPATETVPTAARDLSAGTLVTGDDVTRVEFAQGTAPTGVADDAVGRLLASPVRAGEPLTDVRFLGPALAAAYPGSAIIPVRLPDAAMAALLRVGDRIDLLAADPEGSRIARVVARDLSVAALPEASDDLTSGVLPGRLVVLSVPDELTGEIAQAAVTGFLSFAFSR